MRIETKTTWWREDSKGCWKEIDNSRRKIPELVVSLFAKSISKSKNRTTIIFVLTLNSYVKRDIGIPTVLQGFKQIDGLQLSIDSIEVRSDPDKVFNDKWSPGEYLFDRSLPKNSNVSLQITVSINEQEPKFGEYCLHFIETRMSDSSPVLFVPVKIVDFAPFEIIRRNQLLYSFYGNNNKKLQGILKVGSYDTIYNGYSLKVKVSDIRIDNEKSYIKGKTLSLMTMNEVTPFCEYAEGTEESDNGSGSERKVKSQTQLLMNRTAHPAMFIGDNTEVISWWYIVERGGTLTIKSPDQITFRGTLTSTTFEVY